MKLLGEPFHIIDTHVGMKKKIEFDELKNIVFHLFTLQMIKFYELFHEGTNGVTNLVIKPHESKILKCRRLERVSITLMIRTPLVELPPLEGDSFLKKNLKHFSVHSYQHIWWHGAFKLNYENLHILHWVFHHTTILEVVKG